MRKVVPVLVAVGLIILIAVGFVGFQVLDRYMPTKERADLAEVYDVSMGMRPRSSITMSGRSRQESMKMDRRICRSPG